MLRSANQDVIAPSPRVAQAGGPTVEDLVDTILDPAGDLTVVGQITPQDNTKIAGTNKLTDPRAMAYFEGGEVGVAGTLLPEENQNVPGDAEYAGGISIEDGICLAGSQLGSCSPIQHCAQGGWQLRNGDRRHI